MAPYESGETGDFPAEGPQRSDGPAEAGAVQTRRAGKAARYVVPFAVIGVAAATIGLVPALADSGDPDLPKISAQQLVEKIAASDVQHLSGTVKINTDLGLPDIGGAAAFVPGAAGGSGAHAPGADSGSAADPQSRLTELLSGAHTLRVATDGPDHQKLSILDRASEYSVIHNGDELWAYDSASNEAYHAKTDKAHRTHRSGKSPEQGKPAATPDELARQVLKAGGDTTSVTVDGTERVANRDAYRLVVKPKQTGSTVGAISIAVDAKTGTALKFTLTPAKGGSAVVDVGYTKVDFGKPAASTFDFTPPKGTKVTEADEARKAQRGQRGQEGQQGLRGPKGLKDLKGPKGLKGLKDSKGLSKGLEGPGRSNGPDDVKVIGKGWDAIAVFTVPGGQGLPSAGSGKLPSDAQHLLDSLGDKAHGKFGSGTVFSTRLINALVTDDGKVYVGAVTKDALVKAANAAH
jgi:outer membrane lipoprotein-sorting protein